MSRGKIVHIKVHESFWKKLKTEATIKGYPSMTKYTEVLGKDSRDTEKVFKKNERKKNYFGF